MKKLLVLLVGIILILTLIISYQNTTINYKEDAGVRRDTTRTYNNERILALINNFRKENGAGHLKESEELCKIANERINFFSKDEFREYREKNIEKSFITYKKELGRNDLVEMSLFSLKSGLGGDYKIGFQTRSWDWLRADLSSEENSILEAWKSNDRDNLLIKNKNGFSYRYGCVRSLLNENGNEVLLIIGK